MEYREIALCIVLSFNCVMVPTPEEHLETRRCPARERLLRGVLILNACKTQQKLPTVQELPTVTEGDLTPERPLKSGITKSWTFANLRGLVCDGEDEKADVPHCRVTAPAAEKKPLPSVVAIAKLRITLGLTDEETPV